MDETPDYFIRDGKIYAHHKGTTYVSGGFRDHEPSYNQLLGDATPININRFLQNNSYLYNYDECRKQTPIESKYKDAFGNNIFEGMIVYCVNTHYDDRFAGYIKGVVVGFTKEFIKIQIMNYDKTIKYHIYDEEPPIKRMPHRVICLEKV